VSVQRCAGCNKPLGGPPYKKGLWPDGYCHNAECYTLALENENKELKYEVSILKKKIKMGM